MRILDESGNAIAEPDLNKGYLVMDEILIAHHPATPEIPRVVERVVEWEDPENPYNKLLKTVVKQEYAPAKPAWDETEQVQRYYLYTAAELAEREQQKAEIEKAAAEAQAKQVRMNELPNEVDALYEAVAEVGVLTSDTALILDDLYEAVAELGVLIAGEE